MVPDQDRERALLWLQEGFLKAEKTGVLTSTMASRIRSVLSLEWSRRMSRTMGMALVHKGGNKAVIRLSAVLWEKASEAEKRETVFHELAHVIVDMLETNEPVRKKRGLSNSKPLHHGNEWVRVMEVFGFPNPSSCHEVVNEDYEKARGNVPLYCACSHEPRVWVSMTRAVRLLQDESRCRKCNALTNDHPIPLYTVLARLSSA